MTLWERLQPQSIVATAIAAEAAPTGQYFPAYILALKFFAGMALWKRDYSQIM